MYCKSNVRRVINYTQTEPINKYDLWLSENARYNEDGELEYDNEGQPACDLILKLFRHGRWEPIVGFNTTALNKINTVDDVSYTPTGSSVPKVGKYEFHPAIFTKDTPGELYDAGTLGELLSDTNFVNSDEWQDLFNMQQFQDAFNTFVINGSNYNWDDIIVSDIDFATTTDIGGILSDTHGRVPGETLRFYPIECKFYPDYDLYLPMQGRLCTNAFETKIAIDYVNYVLYKEDPTSELIVNGWKGITTETRDNHSGVWIGIDGVNSSNSSKIPVVNKDGDGIEWVNMPSHESYLAGNGITIDNNKINQNIKYCQKQDLSGELRVVSMFVQDVYYIVVTKSTGSGAATLISEYEVFDDSESRDYIFDLSYLGLTTETSTNPIYMKINAKTITIADGTKYICDSLVDNSIPGGEYLVTILFGIIKFEKINTYSNV